MQASTRLDRLAGALLGAAVGDALGLPREGLSAERAERLLGPRPLRYRFLAGRGMVSDDAEHAAMVAEALCVSGGEPEGFARELARRLRRWSLCIPAGVGWATLRACVRLCLGLGPERSGVPSAGNGPAMRSGVIGVWCGGDERLVRQLTRASTRLTHTHPRAEDGALLIALAASHAARAEPGTLDAQALLAGLAGATGDDDLRRSLDEVALALREGVAPAELCARIGSRRGVSGYVGHTVPVALHCWLRHPTDFRAVVEEAICLGGDADTVGSIAGTLAGAGLGASGIPAELLAGLRDWPRSVAWFGTLAEALAEARPGVASRPPSAPLPAVLARNVLFAGVVLGHGLRRLLPPW
jgi:ADP-ribosyl-[dinitrogen reductase] hydrolase